MPTFYLWHLVLGFGSALGGLFHIVYCGRYFSTGVGLWNAALLWCIAARGFFSLRSHPGPRFLVYSHLCLLLMAVLLSSLSAVGLFCILNDCPMEDTRGFTVRKQCMDRLMIQTHYSYADLETINQAVDALLLGFGCMQMLLCAYCLRKMLPEFWEVVQASLNRYYALCLLGVLSLFFGTASTAYCAHGFFTGAFVWLCLPIFAAGYFGNKRKSKRQRAVKFVLTLAMLSSIGLATLPAYGLFCWQPVPLQNFSVSDQRCLPNSRLLLHQYHACYDRLERLGLHDFISDTGLKDLRNHQAAFNVLLLACASTSAVLCATALAALAEDKRRRFGIAQMVVPVAL